MLQERGGQVLLVISFVSIYFIMPSLLHFLPEVSNLLFPYLPTVRNFQAFNYSPFISELLLHPF